MASRYRSAPRQAPGRHVAPWQPWQGPGPQGGSTRDGDARRHGFPPCALAPALAEAVRAGVAALGLTHADHPRGILTLGIGLAHSAWDPGAATQDRLRSADEALYAAKRQGRDRVRLARPKRGFGPADAPEARAARAAAPAHAPQQGARRAQQAVQMLSSTRSRSRCRCVRRSGSMSGAAARLGGTVWPTDERYGALTVVSGPPPVPV